MESKTVEVIIPVQNMAHQLAKVVTPLIAQCSERDVITVVDDASTDKTGEVAKALGANVVRIENSGGPYRARQTAAMRSSAAVLLFVDGRSRPLTGLLEAHRQLQSRDGVVLSCTEVRTRSGPSLAARVAELQQPFSLQGRLGVPGRPDFFPTCNLGIDATAFRAVDGFRAMRSGGDADICWRIQESKLGSMAGDPRVLMEWEPRESFRDLASQYRRYGESTVYLHRVWGDFTSAPHGPDESFVDVIKSEIKRRRAIRRATPLEVLARTWIDTVFQYGFIEAKLKRGEFTPPQSYDVADKP